MFVYVLYCYIFISTPTIVQIAPSNVSVIFHNCVLGTNMRNTIKGGYPNHLNDKPSEFAHFNYMQR